MRRLFLVFCVSVGAAGMIAGAASNLDLFIEGALLNGISICALFLR